MEEQTEASTSTKTSEGGGGGDFKVEVERVEGTDVKQQFSPAAIVDDKQRNNKERASLNEDLALSNGFVVAVSDGKPMNDV